ncbi:hypothetical protein V7S43_011497 [Phytophthora oleae]|uniref:RxLR effector protein n=1 Tax=Phytophthora oleae TaxID=2107226 RepID=A0ABD3FD28_9STRA
MQNQTPTSVVYVVPVFGQVAEATSGRAKEMSLIPADWKNYSKTLVCMHGQPDRKRGRGMRQHKRLQVTATGGHNHDVNAYIWNSYAENRVVKDQALKRDVAVLHKDGATAKGILSYLREQTGKRTNLKDVHNMVQSVKLQQKGGLNYAQRALAVLNEFWRYFG